MIIKSISHLSFLAIFSIIILTVFSCTSTKKNTTNVLNQPRRTVDTPVREKPIIIEPVVVETAPVLLNSLTKEEKAQGWKLLFDGSSTDGWHAYGSRTIGNAWRVKDGLFYLDAQNKDGWQVKSGGDIVTDEVYSNFELQLEWKIEKNGNSGICIYVHEDKDKYPYMWSTGPEMQILDNDGHSDGKIVKHRAGDLYDLISSKENAVKPVMTWNKVKIVSNNGKLDFYLNGINVVSTTMWNTNWYNLIANSKFGTMPGFGTFQSGRIGLQDHGNNVWFRNIKIRRL